MADYTNDRIRRLTNLTGSAATVSTLNVFPVIARPSGVAHLNLGGVDWLVVPSTQTNKVHLVNSANGQSFIIAGTGAAGSADGAGGTATFNQPSDAAVIGSALFITDLGGRIIRQLNLKSGAEPSFASSWVVKTLAGSGSNGNADGGGAVAQFGSPRYLAADRSGSLYATDLTNNRVRRITGVSGTLPITGTGGSGGTVSVANPDHFLPAPDFSPARAAFLLPDLQPSGQAGDSAQKDIEFVISSGVSSFSFFVSIVADGDSIAVLDAVANSTTNLKGSPNVNVRTLVGRSVTGFDDGDAATATYSSPTIAVCRNAIYSIGTSQALVRRFDLATGVTRSIAGLTSAGTTVAGTGTTSSIPSPIGLWVNENETEIYVVTARHVVVRLSRTSGLASDSDSWTVAIIAGLDGTSGNITGSGSSARFNIPAGIVADSTGSTLYICDALNNCIKKMTILGDLNRNVPSNWFVSQFAGSTSGASGFVDGAGSFARFDTPLGITASRDGTLYVTESDGNRIRRVQLNASVSLLAGSVDGAPDSVDGIGPNARFNQPRGITLDESGFAYVADAASNCVRRVNLKSLEVSTVAGQRGVLGILDGSGSSCLLNLPYSVSFRPGLGLYVSDGATIRVIERTIRTGQP